MKWHFTYDAQSQGTPSLIRTTNALLGAILAPTDRQLDLILQWEKGERRFVLNESGLAAAIQFIESRVLSRYWILWFVDSSFTSLRPAFPWPTWTRVFDVIAARGSECLAAVVPWGTRELWCSGLFASEPSVISAIEGKIGTLADITQFPAAPPRAFLATPSRSSVDCVAGFLSGIAEIAPPMTWACIALSGYLDKWTAETRIAPSQAVRVPTRPSLNDLFALEAGMLTAKGVQDWAKIVHECISATEREFILCDLRTAGDESLLRDLSRPFNQLRDLHKQWGDAYIITNMNAGGEALYVRLGSQSVDTNLGDAKLPSDVACLL